MFNDWAIRKWSKVLSDDFSLDKATFLICSLIPISYIDIVDDENFVVVNLSDIRKYTNVVKEGCDFLVKNGYAKWLTKNRQYNNTDYDQISIGTSPDFITAVYYFEASKRISTSIPTKQTTAVKKSSIDKNNISDTITLLDEWYEQYKIFCAKIHSKSKAEKIHAKIKTVLDNVIITGNMTPVELLTYLDCLNAMKNDWLDIPNSYTNIKLKQMAKQVIAKTTAENLLKLIPYYVDNYPKIAKQGFEETNVYNLSFHFTSMMNKMNGSKVGNKTKTYDDDKL